MADNETKRSPSKVCLSYSDNELLIPTPWSDESKNEKRQKGKRWRQEFKLRQSLFEIDFTFGMNSFSLKKGNKVMKNNLSQEYVCEEEVPLNNNIGKVSHVIEMPSEAVDQGMDDHMPDEIDGVECYTHSGCLDRNTWYR
ncbi:hypothetical protein Tco_0213352 [Tanacetum coccineum]